VHDNYKQGIVDASVSGSIAVPMGGRAVAHVLRTELSEAMARGEAPSGLGSALKDLYVDGRLDLAVGSAGESAGLVNAVEPVAAIIDRTIAGFWREIDRLAALRG
jgi:enoyl-[acyl-carrier protein] reductase II